MTSETFSIFFPLEEFMQFDHFSRSNVDPCLHRASFVCAPLGCCSEDEESPAESGGRAAVEARVEGEAAAAAVKPTWLLEGRDGSTRV